MNDDDAQLSNRSQPQRYLDGVQDAGAGMNAFSSEGVVTTISPVRARQLHDQKEEQSDEPKARVDEWELQHR